MKVPPITRGLIAVSILILAAGAGIGWWELRRPQHERREMAVAAAGKSATHADGRRLIKRQRDERPAGPEVDLADVVAVAADSLSSRTAGTPKDEAARKREVDLSLRISALNPSQLRKFIDLVKTCPDLDTEHKRWFAMLGIRAFADQDADGALAMVSADSTLFVSTNVGIGLVSSLIGTRAEEDPRAAVIWLRKLSAEHPELHPDRARLLIISKAAENDPGLAFKITGELSGPGNSELVKAALNKIVATAKTDEDRLASLSGLREFLLTVGDPDLRGRLQSSVIEKMTRGVGEGGFESAATWLARAKMNREEQWSFACGLSSDFTKQDTGHWIDWLGREFPVNSLSDDTRREKWGSMVHGLIGDWAELDSPSAGKWLETLPQGDVRDYCVSGFARTLARKHPDTAAEWVMTLPSEQNRKFMLNVIYEAVSRDDPEAAAAFAARHGIE